MREEGRKRGGREKEGRERGGERVILVQEL